jgi:hypothetical protein
MANNNAWNFILHLAISGLHVAKLSKFVRKTVDNSSTTANVNSAEQLWRTTMYFTFFDHVNNELECRFPGDQRQMMLGQYHLVDSVVDELSTVFNVLRVCILGLIKCNNHIAVCILKEKC